MVKSSREFYSIIVVGPFSSGKTTFLEAACSEIGGMMLQRGRIATVGQFALNEKLGVYLYETSHFHLDFKNIPGKLLGCVVIVNNTFPETFREAKSIIAFFRVYTKIPITVVANPYSYKKRESWTQEGVRFALQIDDSIPLIECDVSDAKAVKSVIDTVGQRFLAADDNRTAEDASLPNGVIDEVDFFTSEKTHRFLTVVSTQVGFDSHEFMDHLSDRITWLKLDNRNVPCRWGYCEVDSSTYLHIIPVERFGTPRDFVGFAFQNLLAMAGEQPAPSPVEEHRLPYNEGTIGCVGLFNSYDEQSVSRAKYMVKVFGDDPYVLVDTGRGSINEPTVYNQAIDEAYLRSRYPIMRVDSKDKDFPRRAMCLLIEQLTDTEAEKWRLKFDCLR